MEYGEAYTIKIEGGLARELVREAARFGVPIEWSWRKRLSVVLGLLKSLPDEARP